MFTGGATPSAPSTVGLCTALGTASRTRTLPPHVLRHKSPEDRWRASRPTTVVWTRRKRLKTEFLVPASTRRQSSGRQVSTRPTRGRSGKPYPKYVERTSNPKANTRQPTGRNVIYQRSNPCHRTKLQPPTEFVLEGLAGHNQATRLDRYSAFSRQVQMPA